MNIKSTLITMLFAISASSCSTIPTSIDENTPSGSVIISQTQMYGRDFNLSIVPNQ